MADPRSIGLRDRLGTRLGIAFLTTALAAVAVATVSALTASSTGVTQLAAEQRHAAAMDVVGTIQSAYVDADGHWGAVDLLPAHTLAASAGAVLVVTLPDGVVLDIPSGFEDVRRRMQLRGPTSGGSPMGPSSSPTEGGARSPDTDDPNEPDTGGSPRIGVEDDATTGVERQGDRRAPVPDSTTRPEGAVPRQQDGQSPGGPGEPRSNQGWQELNELDAGIAVLAWMPSAVVREFGPPDRGLTRPAQATEAAPNEVIDGVEERVDLPVVVDGTQVATASLLFVNREGPDPVAAFQAELVRRLLLGAAVAGVLAVIVTMFVTSRLTRPLRRLTVAVDELRRGGSEALGDEHEVGPGEIGVLQAAIDSMASDLRQQERLRRALVADVGHELRTPVSILLGELEALRDGVYEADAEQLASLFDEVQRIARLVEDVGSLADAEAAGFSLDLEPLDLAEVTAAALQGFEVPFAADEVSLAIQLQPVMIEGDRRRVEQVVRNLMTNANRFAPPHTSIAVSVRPDGADAVLEVTDRGPGFDPEGLGHAFERFWQASHTVGGSGIGLAVVAEVVAAHGGSVVAANRQDGGARLTVRFPRMHIRTDRGDGVRDPATDAPPTLEAAPRP